MTRRETHTELAIPDLQRRLAILGYRLGDEAEKGLFGENTAAAVASFKASTGLGSDDVLDQTTWTTIVDASMQMGDRTLYLHMPHFRGRDVGELQGALSSMGFACAVDSIFGPETEQALRDCQQNLLLDASGILDDETLDAILRLQHVWEGKRGFMLEGRSPSSARSHEVLEGASVCFFGNNEQTRAIANRIANLARATTADAGIASAASLETVPGKDMLLIGLEQRDRGSEKPPPEDEDGGLPTAHLMPAPDFEQDFKRAIIRARELQNRLTIVLADHSSEAADQSLEQLQAATLILDSLCAVLPLASSR